jgi:cytochrome oxidase Cu insertion factor (SCO1/SenC/PrrC family)
MYPHERSLVKDLADKPFVILGINSDPDREGLKPTLLKEQITWRSFWNGQEGTSGPISTKWNVHGWPSIYILDAKGVIRYKSVGANEKEIDATIDKLLKEMGAAEKK